MQTHEGLFTSLSLGPSIPDTAEQGLEPQSGLQLGFLWAGWPRGFSKGVEEFLKFCLHSGYGAFKGIELCFHSNMELSTMGVGSVFILIGAF